jgi:hypothetical protein
VVDDKGDRNRGQGGRCCPGKSSRERGKKKKSIAVDKRKMATGRGENEKNVQEKKEDSEHVLETSWGRFRKDLRSSSSWGPVAKKSY